ncbi:MAG: hypothetical protein OXU96_03705, partial [Gammaproteobacteria bacterium]|nr:hypothetical protein [Gammaproteobacteria bacterium]
VLVPGGIHHAAKDVAGIPGGFIDVFLIDVFVHAILWRTVRMAAAASPQKRYRIIGRVYFQPFLF